MPRWCCCCCSGYRTSRTILQAIVKLSLPTSTPALHPGAGFELFSSSFKDTICVSESPCFSQHVCSHSVHSEPKNHPLTRRPLGRKIPQPLCFLELQQLATSFQSTFFLFLFFFSQLIPKRVKDVLHNMGDTKEVKVH